ncbi:TetR/AcrR family transcriptional regulator [Arthrobacter mobilis]|uniref:TetR/AcrR family transcriptional regulator n=1 Tax=Arthrobacter mobilis TaxID=2724944 RepID=A0A7X6K4R9_9MICC|nr:TetR/AcrR family transcriptional regulator C-terminal domain-containing protein [Arthrobacter mobilis]NKX53015.1 TetR/AcrR family transcriptional regulator [Arthrobacter mobilis]
MPAALRRRAGRPSEGVLTRELILVTALKVLNRLGPDKFTLAALADELGVKTPALYHHVGGKSDILAGMREYVTQGIDTSAFGVLPWPEAVMSWARSYRSAFAAHPYAIALLATLPVTGAEQTLQMYERTARGFRGAGWPEEDVVNTIVALENFILGSALDAVAPEDMFDTGGFADQVPVFDAAVRVRHSAAGTAGSAAEQAFELGLAAMVEGLEARRKALAAGE